MPAFVTLTNLANKDLYVFSVLNHMKLSESLLWRALGWLTCQLVDWLVGWFSKLYDCDFLEHHSVINAKLCRLVLLTEIGTTHWHWLVLLTKILLHYVWVTVTSHFPMQLVTLVSFLTASLHWRNRWTNSVNLPTWRSGGSVQSDTIFLLKTPTLSFPFLFSSGLIIVMLFLLSSGSPW